MTQDDENINLQSKELRILTTMRRVLASVIREITPQPGMRNPLSQETIEDVRQCFSLIVARERELAAASKNPTRLRPQFIDEPATSHTVEFEPGKKK